MIFTEFSVPSFLCQKVFITEFSLPSFLWRVIITEFSVPNYFLPSFVYRVFFARELSLPSFLYRVFFNELSEPSLLYRVCFTEFSLPNFLYRLIFTEFPLPSFLYQVFFAKELSELSEPSFLYRVCFTEFSLPSFVCVCVGLVYRIRAEFSTPKCFVFVFFSFYRVFLLLLLFYARPTSISEARGVADVARRQMLRRRRRVFFCWFFCVFFFLAKAPEKRGETKEGRKRGNKNQSVSTRWISSCCFVFFFFLFLSVTSKMDRVLFVPFAFDSVKRTTIQQSSLGPPWRPDIESEMEMGIIKKKLGKENSVQMIR